MDRDTKQVVRWWIIVALGLLVFRLIQACTPPQTVPAPFTLVFVDSLPSGDAVTDCKDGMTRVSILKRIGPDDYPELFAHELTHVHQMARWEARHHEGCEAYLSLYKSNQGMRLGNEAEAYCQGVKTRGDMWPERVQGIISYLVENYKLTVSRDSISRTVIRTCKHVFANPP